MRGQLLDSWTQVKNMRATLSWRVTAPLARREANEVAVILLSPSSGRPRVIDEVAGKVICEQGALPDSVPDRVAILVHYSTSPNVNRSFRTLVREFANAGYLPLVVSASPVPGPARLGRRPAGAGGRAAQAERRLRLRVLGGRAAARCRRSKQAEHVVLANDSVVGPFTSLAPQLAAFEQSDADVWGLTDTRQYFHHLQSYFIGFRRGVLADKPLAEFWTDRRHERTKWDIIRRNELALSQLFRDEGYIIDRGVSRRRSWLRPVRTRSFAPGGS